MRNWSKFSEKKNTNFKINPRRTKFISNYGYVWLQKTFTRLVKRFGQNEQLAYALNLITENITICLVAKIKIFQKEASFIDVIYIVTQHSGKKCCVTTQVTPAQETAFEFS